MTEAVAASGAPIVAPVAGDAAPIIVAPTTGPAIGEEEVVAPVVTPEADKGPTAFVYDKTNEPGLDMALSFVGKLGLGPTDPAMAAAIKGDFGMLKAKLAGMGAKATGWEQYVALAEESDKQFKETQATKVKADTENVHNAVGGAENWKAISKWAGENATPEEKASVNAALKGGGLQAKLMAEWLAGKYSKAKGTTVTPATVVKDGAKAAPGATGALTAAAYATEVQALRQKMGFKMDGSPAYQALQARRNAGRRSGM